MAKFPNTVVFNVEFDWKDIRREMVEGFWSIFEQVANSLENILDDLDAEDQPEEIKDDSTKENIIVSDDDPSSWIDFLLNPDEAKDDSARDDPSSYSSSHCCNFWCTNNSDNHPNHASWNDLKTAVDKGVKYGQHASSTVVDADINDAIDSLGCNKGEINSIRKGSLAAMVAYNLLEEDLDQDFVKDFNRTAQELNIGVELVETDDRDSLDDDQDDETQGGMVWNDFVAKFFPVVPTPLPYSSDRYKWR